MTRAECMGGLICTAEGRCVAGCSNDRGCPTDELCIDAVCRPDTSDGGATDASAMDSGGTDSGAMGSDAGDSSAMEASTPDATGGSDASADGGPLFTTLLDRFDRADGALNSAGVTQWLEYDHAGPMQYVVAGNKLSGTLQTGVPLWWDVPFGGADAVTEAFITVGSLSADVTDFSLLLASQTLSFCDFVRVFYEPLKGTISAVSCQDGMGKIYGTPASVGLLTNVRLGAKFETKSGKLTVYLDDALVGSWTIDQWRYLGKAGRIGMWLHREPTGTRGPDTFDDFGGR
jgi:hypothetical protein